MIVNALMPLVHDRQTGGSVYNRHVLRHLMGAMAVEVHLDSPDANRALWPGGLWLVDSLCLDSGAAHLRERPDATGVLVAHYLHCLDPNHRSSARARAELELLRRYRAVVATSPFVGQALAAAGFPVEVDVIPPGLEPAFRQPTCRSPRATPAILTVASLVPAKGPLEMLQALETLADLDWRWELVGDTELDAVFYRRFQASLLRSPLQDRIVLRGALPATEIRAAYDRSDIFALPSHFETCSMVTMEAMARGLPIAAFKVGGLPDLLPAASRQLLAEPGEMRGLMKTLRHLLTNADEGYRLGEDNRQASGKFPGWDDSGHAMECLLRRLSTPSK